MTEIIWSVIIITKYNLAEAERIYSKKDIMSSTNGTPIEFAAGKMIVTQTIHTDDPFDSRFKCTHEYHWLATRPEFDTKFYFVDDGNETDTFSIIAKK